jgi:hypothetical protein
MVLMVEYHNHGQAPALNTFITSTLEGGLEYLSDTSGFPHTWTGLPGDPVVWQLGEVPPGTHVNFRVYALVTALVGEVVTHTVQIETFQPYAPRPLVG